MPEKLKMFGHEQRPKHNFNSGARVSNPFYQTRQWKQLRLLVLAQQPYCVQCESLGYYITAKVVDHITPINQGGAATSMDNLQSLCTKCHNSKSGKEKNK